MIRISKYNINTAIPHGFLAEFYEYKKGHMPIIEEYKPFFMYVLFFFFFFQPVHLLQFLGFARKKFLSFQGQEKMV